MKQKPQLCLTLYPQKSSREEMIYYLCLPYNIKTLSQLAPFPYSCGLFGPFCSVDRCPQLDPQKDTAK